jgi:hypothetical protein
MRTQRDSSYLALHFTSRYLFCSSDGLTNDNDEEDKTMTVKHDQVTKDQWIDLLVQSWFL